MNNFWLGFILGMPIWGSLGAIIIALVMGGNRDDS